MWGSILLLIIGGWLIAQTLIGDLPGRIMSWSDAQ